MQLLTAASSHSVAQYPVMFPPPRALLLHVALPTCKQRLPSPPCLQNEWFAASETYMENMPRQGSPTPVSTAWGDHKCGKPVCQHTETWEASEVTCSNFPHSRADAISHPPLCSSNPWSLKRLEGEHRKAEQRALPCRAAPHPAGQDEPHVGENQHAQRHVLIDHPPAAAVAGRASSRWPTSPSSAALEQQRAHCTDSCSPLML